MAVSAGRNLAIVAAAVLLASLSACRPLDFFAGATVPQADRATSDSAQNNTRTPATKPAITATRASPDEAGDARATRTPVRPPSGTSPEQSANVVAGTASPSSTQPARGLATAGSPAGPTEPSPTAISVGRVLLRDDFADAKSGFTSWPTGTIGHYGYGRGFYYMSMLTSSGSSASSTYAISYRSEPVLGDFLLTVDAQIDAPKRDGAYSVLLRFQDADNYYKFSVDPNTGHFTVSRLSGNQRTTLIDWRKSSAINAGAERNSLGVLSRGSDIAVYINGELVGATTDTAFAHGKIGFMVNAWSEPFSTRFTNLVVTEPP